MLKKYHSPEHKAIIRAAQQGVRHWANGQTLEDLEMDPQRIKRIRQMNEERVSVWGDNVQIERRLLPVSVKTRLGYDSIVISDCVQELLELEPAVISIHWRTLAQHYKGEANWDAIAAAEDIPDVIPSREERLLMALEHAHVHAKLKGEDHYVEMRKHMGWYLGHFPGAKHVRSKLVRINALADVERIIHAALDNLEAFKDEAESLQEETFDSELDLTCVG